MIETDKLTCDKFLGGQLELWQPRTGYRAGTDPVLMAAAVPAKDGETFLEIGCGVGTAALCLAFRTGASGAGLEIQADYAELARRNAAHTGLSFDVFEGDVHAVPSALRARNFEHVMLNPPYFGESSGTPAADLGRDLALRDKSDLSVWLEAAAKRVTPKGTLTVIVRAERLRTVLTALPEMIGSLRVLPLTARMGRAAKRVIVQGRKDGRAPLVLLPPLILHDGTAHTADGDDFSTEAACILRKGGGIDLQSAIK